MNVLKKALPILLILGFGLAVLHAALVGLLPSPGCLTSPAAFVPWALLFLICAAWPFVFPMEKKGLFSFLRLHAPLALVVLAAAAALLTARSADLFLAEGDRLDLADAFAKVGLEGEAGALVLKKFEIVADPADARAVRNYRSSLMVTRDGRETAETIEVNRPLSLGPLTLSQKSWSVAVRRVEIELQGARFTFNDRKAIGLPDGRFFLIRPEGWDRKLHYRWQIISAGEQVLSEGTVTEGGVPYELTRLGFGIVEEDYAFASVLQASYTPLLGALGALAAAALLFMAAEFWLVGKIKRPRKPAP